MATELRTSAAPQDPFADCSLPSILPLTLSAYPLPPSPAEAIDSLLRSMALKGSEEAIVQAKEISMSRQTAVDSSRNRDELAAAPASGRDRNQVRRPALGRKRAEFSLKPPIARNSVPSVDTSSQIEHIEDPEEYFLAFEQLENADKELKKLRGEVASADPFLLSSTARKHRPGITGRTASYRHHFSAADTAEAFSASQEAIPDAKTSSPTKASKLSKSSETSYQERLDKEPKAASGELPEVSNIEGLAVEKDKNSNNLLEHLLSSFKSLNEAQSTTLLCESLQIKKIDVGKINLPQLNALGTNDVGPLNNMVTEDKSTGDRLLQLSSATTRRPVAAISRPVNPVIDRAFSLVDKLRRRASEADKFSDDSSDTEEEVFERNECSRDNIMKQSYSQEIDKMAVCDKLDSHMDDDGNDMRLDEVTSAHPDPEVEDPISRRTGFVEKNCNNVVEDGHVSGTDIHFTLEGVDFTMQDEGTVMVQDENAACARKEESSSTVVKNVTHGTLSGTEVHVSLEGVDVTMQHKDTVTVQDEPEAHTESPSDICTLMAKDIQMDGLSTVECDITSRNDKIQEAQEVAVVAERKSKKQRTGSREQKLHSRRKSLAAAGMTWDSGVRKSTRIKSRPLQYWLGERFLYGRIHDSLATVIGKKITTPGKDGKGPKLKIESFVPEEYADLLAQVARS